MQETLPETPKIIQVFEVRGSVFVRISKIFTGFRKQRSWKILEDKDISHGRSLEDPGKP